MIIQSQLLPPQFLGGPSTLRLLGVGAALDLGKDSWSRRPEDAVGPGRRIRWRAENKLPALWSFLVSFERRSGRPDRAPNGGVQASPESSLSPRSLWPWAGW